MATGMMDTRRGHRLTAVRVVLLLVFIAAAMMAPHSVYATEHEFSSEVRFPAEGIDVQYVADFSSAPHDHIYSSDLNWVSSGTEGGGPGYSKTTTGGTGINRIPTSDWAPIPGETYTVVMRASDEGGAGTDLHIGLQFRNAAGASLGQCTLNIHPAAHSSPGTFATYTVPDCVAPAGATFGAFYASGHRVKISVFNIWGNLAGGTCLGTKGPTGDEQLVWPSASLSSPTGHSQWGDQWLSADEACSFARNAVVHFTPAGGFHEGHTYQFGFQAWVLNAARRATLTATWVRPGPGGGDSVTAFQWQSDSAAPMTGTDIVLIKLDAPPGVSHISFSFSDWFVLRALLIANIEGDPIQDGGDYPWSDVPGWEHPDAADYWGDCSPPEDALNVPGWLEYGACIVIGGFEFVGGLIGGIARDMATVFANVMAPFFGMIASAIGDALAVVFGTLGDILGDVLTLLFVPTGTAWDDFIALVSGKVPFGWFAEATGAIETGLGAGATALPGSFTLTLGSASVNMGDPIDDALAAVSPYRGIIFAGVALLMIIGCIRWIMAAVGVSPSHASEGSD